MTCDDTSFIGSMQLKTSGASVNYEYSCCHAAEATQATCTDKSTDLSEAPKIHYLDRHDINCGATGLLNHIALSRGESGSDSHDKVKYDYTCCELPNVKTTCRSSNTQLDDDGGENMHFLDRHHVDCNEGEFLNRLHLSRGGTEHKMQYEYTCCSYITPEMPVAMLGGPGNENPFSQVPLGGL